LFVAPAMAADGPAQLIQLVADQVIEIVKSAKGPAREAAIQKILTTNFDMAYMGRAALGTHWEATTPPERERYLAAVASAEAHAYSERFGQYAGQTLTVGILAETLAGRQQAQPERRTADQHPMGSPRSRPGPAHHRRESRGRQHGHD
jgi:ABC-type transporter MlaC component